MSTLRQIRPNDYALDPSFITSGAKDYYKQAYLSKVLTAKFAICPIFPTMFSDLRNYPRKEYVLRKTTPVPMYSDKVHEVPTVSTIPKGIIVGPDRHKYFHNPVQIKDSVPKLDMTCFYEVDEEKKQKKKKVAAKKKGVSVNIQTQYRDSSAQTSPWQPEYVVKQGDPELLKLDFLKWGQGLPAGKNEVNLIERARMKCKWKSAMPMNNSRSGENERRRIIETIEVNEWLFREKEIAGIQEIRMQLLEKMMNEMHEKARCRNEKKMRMFIDNKLKEKKEKLATLHKNSDREKRRLKFNYKGILSKYGHVNVYNEHVDFKSELYVPLVRHGNNPRYGHQIISTHLQKYKSQYYGVEDFNTLPRDLDDTPNIKEVKLRGTRLCISETKWTTPVLKHLYEDLKNLRHVEKPTVNLRVRIEREVKPLATPEIEPYDEIEETKFQAAIFLQAILRGRAAQLTIFEGRDRCRELINELRCNFALLRSNINNKIKHKEKTKQDQMNATRCMQNMRMIKETLSKMTGVVTGTLLDFLNKELTRLLNERKVHAMSLLVERERLKREAAEAGRRQYELRRRQEHDEIFKQVVKVHQDTVDLYLQDIITEGMDFSSACEAKQYVDRMAEKVDEENRKTAEKMNDSVYKEEYIANLVHHFVIPEVAKNIVRQKAKIRERRRLQTAHNEIYNQIEKLPQPPSKGQTELQKAMKEEKKTVMADIKSILEDIMGAPIQKEILENVEPCTPSDEVKSPSFSSSDDFQTTMGLEAYMDYADEGPLGEGLQMVMDEEEEEHPMVKITPAEEELSDNTPSAEEQPDDVGDDDDANADGDNDSNADEEEEDTEDIAQTD